MLEQDLHNQATNNRDVQDAPVQNFIAPEKDLFRNYEIRNWEFSPRFYKILAASAVFNVMTLLVFAQSNLLTRKGCESPMVSKVCQVLDTVYIGSILMGTDAEFASREYEKTEIEDANEIVYHNVTTVEPPLNYPEGYFAIANPEEYAMRQQEMLMNGGSPSGFEMPPTGSIAPINPTSPSSDLMNVTPTLPPTNNNPILGNIPTSPLGSNPTTRTPTFPRFQGRKFPRPKPIKTPKLRNESPKTLPDLETETAKTEPKEKEKEEPKQPDLSSLPVADEIINKKPLQDFGDEVLDKVNAKTVDLTKAFAIEMQGIITKDGKFDAKKSRYVKTDGDQEMVNIAKSAIEAIGDSGLLTYLQKLDVEKINFTLVQDENFIYAIITSEQKTDSKAKTISSGLNTAIALGKPTIKEADTLILLNSAKIEAQGKNFVLNFKLEKPVAQEMINRQLTKAQAKRQEQQKPSGTAENNSNQNSGK